MRSTGVRRIGAAGLLAVLAGCAGPQARQDAEIDASIQAVTTDFLDCARAAYAAPDMDAVRPLLPFDARQATAAQMADPNRATPTQVAAMLRLHERLAGCRRVALAQYLQAAPGMVPPLVDSYAKSDRNTVALVQGRESWGAFVTDGHAISAQAEKELTAALREMDAEMEAGRLGEMSRRDQATAVVAAYLRQQTPLTAAPAPSTASGPATGPTQQARTRPEPRTPARQRPATKLAARGGGPAQARTGPARNSVTIYADDKPHPAKAPAAAAPVAGTPAPPPR